jgi:beta-lactamase superfamily II metal-dependent hydrolase
MLINEAPMATRIYVLDPGAVNYGDAILCVVGDRTILIDGARSASAGHTTSVVHRRTTRHTPIQDQIREILGHTHVHLLVITHCHSDHIGCLPELVGDGTLTCDWALVADIDLGFGVAQTDAARPNAREMSPEQKLAAALREEPLLAGTDEEIAAFIEDSAAQYEEYAGLVTGLQETLGERLVFFTGSGDGESPGLAALLEEFGETGLSILGPNQAQLLLCAEFLTNRFQDNLRDSAEVMADVNADVVSAYRRITGSTADSVDPDADNGNAVNNQSIIVALATDGGKILLTGDMQFAKPQVDARVSEEVRDLLTRVTGFGPYRFVKLSHHGATNGQDLTILMGWEAKSFAISTGARSTHHPTKPTRDVLEMLRDDEVRWARTDMNGRITYTLNADGTDELEIERGELNDLSPPTAQGDTEALVVEPAVPLPSQQPIVRRTSGDVVEVIVKIPHVRTRVSVTIDVQGVESDAGDQGGPPRDPFDRPTLGGANPLWSGRDPLPRLLFVTDPERLGREIGATAGECLAAIRAAGQPLLEAPAQQLLAETRKRLQAESGVQGVVLLGGYGVVPSRALLTTPPKLRDLGIDDDDEFVVWSDDDYGDRDGAGAPALPVSRVPDGHSGDFFRKVLEARPMQRLAARAGIRNIARPFAERIHSTLPGTAAMFTSEHRPPASPPPFAVTGDLLYLMLHGQWQDASHFKGEGLGARGRYPVAMRLEDVPNPSPVVVFCGCCYGALIVNKPALLARSGGIASRRSDESIALTFLENGANAFVGCTGVHYSPRIPPFAYHGGPFHEAFWSACLAGASPALALWQAKVNYIRQIPHAGGDQEDEAYEHKIARQFTCLGLGW